MFIINKENIYELASKKSELEQIKNATRSEINLIQYKIKFIDLLTPKTVCISPDCLILQETFGISTISYRVCPKLLVRENENYCSACKCHFSHHIQINTDQKIKRKIIPLKNISKNGSTIEDIFQAIEISETTHIEEQTRIQHIILLLSYFLKKNSIIPYNEFYNLLIEKENDNNLKKYRIPNDLDPIKGFEFSDDEITAELVQLFKLPKNGESIRKIFEQAQNETISLSQYWTPISNTINNNYKDYGKMLGKEAQKLSQGLSYLQRQHRLNNKSIGNEDPYVKITVMKTKNFVKMIYFKGKNNIIELFGLYFEIYRVIMISIIRDILIPLNKLLKKTASFLRLVRTIFIAICILLLIENSYLIFEALVYFIKNFNNIRMFFARMIGMLNKLIMNNVTDKWKTMYEPINEWKILAVPLFAVIIGTFVSS